MLDLEEIERFVAVATGEDGHRTDLLHVVLEDVPALIARVRELEAALSEQSETVQREWLSPFEKEGWRREIEQLRYVLGMVEWLQRTCPWCDGVQPYRHLGADGGYYDGGGHASDCPRQAALG